jgi:8-oxo-dGTP pyrophosphatase MutT (NUDIX family)
MQEETPKIRDAASIILFTESAEGLRILMGIRNAGHKFLPNHMVFPGGGVDEEDFAAPVASPLPGHALARLERAGSPALAAALGHAAARELAEETGLHLGAPPALAGLDYLCRAVTPPSRSIRFNARFFIGSGERLQGEIAGSGELESLDWYPLSALLEMDLAIATKVVLQQAQIWLELSAAARASRNVPVFIFPDWIEE